MGEAGASIDLPIPPNPSTRHQPTALVEDPAPQQLALGDPAQERRDVRAPRPRTGCRTSDGDWSCPGRDRGRTVRGGRARRRPSRLARDAAPSRCPRLPASLPAPPSPPLPLASPSSPSNQVWSNGIRAPGRTAHRARPKCRCLVALAPGREPAGTQHRHDQRLQARRAGGSWCPPPSPGRSARAPQAGPPARAESARSALEAARRGRQSSRSTGDLLARCTRTLPHWARSPVRDHTGLHRILSTESCPGAEGPWTSVLGLGLLHDAGQYQPVKQWIDGARARPSRDYTPSGACRATAPATRLGNP